MILNQAPADGLADYLEHCEDVGADVSAVHTTATRTIEYLKASKKKRATLRLDQDLENQWYEGLDQGWVDWSVYGDDRYLGDLWACWIIYSRQYLKNIVPPSSMPPLGVATTIGRCKRIVDLGCGIGYTTAALSEAWPNAEVWGTNLPDIRQTRIAERMSDYFGFNVVSALGDLPASADLVFASEYFEHIPAPLEHLDDVLGILQPRALLIANTFTARSIGHFNRYRVNGEMVPGRRMSTLFNKILRDRGYVKQETKLWNNRPSFWMKGH